MIVSVTASSAYVQSLFKCVDSEYYDARDSSLVGDVRTSWIQFEKYSFDTGHPIGG